MNKKDLSLLILLGENIVNALKKTLDDIDSHEESKRRKVESETIKKEAESIVEYTFNGEFPVIKDWPKKNLKGIMLSKFPPRDTTESSMVDLKDILGFQDNWEQLPMRLDYLRTLNDKFYKKRLKIGGFKNDTLKIGLILDKDIIYEGYLPFNVSVYTFIMNIEHCRRFGNPNIKAEDVFDSEKST